MSRPGDFHPLELLTPDGSDVHSPMDRTTSLSPSSSTSTAELVSTSAPVNIPVPQNKQEHPTIQRDDISVSVMPMSDEFDHNTVFGSFAMTQSLRTNPDSSLEAPRAVQRAISTNARMEHPWHQRGEGDTDDSPSPAVEDPFFPFLSPDLGGDMVSASAMEMHVSAGMSDSLISDVDQTGGLPDGNVAPEGLAQKKKRWMITKGLSEADIGHYHQKRNHVGRIMTLASSTNEVQPTNRSGIPASKANLTNRHLGRQNSRGLRRKSSVSSNLSAFGNYVFGSSLFQSPARSQSSVTSEKVNIVTDSLGIYPSMASLTSAEVALLQPFEDELVVPLSSSVGRSASASSSRQNSRHDLQQQDSSERRKAHSRSSSVASRSSSVSLFTRSVARESDDRMSLRDEEEATDRLTDVKPTIARAVPPKKQWQQTMPDLVEGPESETLTVHSTTRKNLAAAALAMAKVGEPEKKPATGAEEGEGEAEPEGARSPRDDSPRVYKKNLFVVCTVFFFSFAAYMSLRNLQSSLNDGGGLGMYSLSCIYAFLFLGSLFTTTIIQRLRPKLSMIIGLLGLLLYNVCNLYPSRATLIPGSCIVGFSLAIMWTSQATYMANNAASYAAATGLRFQDCLSQFHGLFFASFQFSQMIGGIISSVIFSLNRGIPLNESSLMEVEAEMPLGAELFEPAGIRLENTTLANMTLASIVENTTSWLAEVTGDYFAEDGNQIFYLFEADNSTMPSVNGSSVLSNETLVDLCGINNCPGNVISRLGVQISPAMYYIMVGVFILSTVVSIVVLVAFLDPLEGAMKNPRAGIGAQLSSVFWMLTDPRVICLLPFMAYTLLQATFVFGEFNKAFVTCYLGIHMIGFMTVCLSIFSSFSAFVTGRLQKLIGPEVIITTGLILHFAVLTSYFIWEPSRDRPYLFFIAVAVWGTGDGILTTLIISLLGVLFVDKKEAVFSTYKMTQAASAFTLFITGPYVCTRKKVMALMIICALSLVGYTALKLRLRTAREKSLQLPNPVSDLTVNLPKDAKS